MYVDPMTLFILGEVLVVYIIINIFLFYKSRLYQVLVALLKEMRFEKLRREQLKKDKLAAEHASNRGLLNHSEHFESLTETAEAKPLPEQLTERIEQLRKKYPNTHDLTNSVEHDESSQWLRLRILELEQELLHGNISEQRWQELAEDAISRLKIKEADEMLSAENRKDSAEGDRYTGQLESDLSESENKLADAKLRIRQLEDELEEMRTISTPSENMMETPRSGIHEDEIYRLKCDNFDLTESINRLKLELQKEDPSAGNDVYVQLIEEQVSNLEQYIKSADIQTGLLEKELSASQKANEELSAKLARLGAKSNTVDLTPLKDLNDQHEAKSETLVSFRETVSRLKEGESPEVISAEQETQIIKLESIIRESQQCIAVLESELQQSTQDIEKLEKELADKKSKLIDAKLEKLDESQQGQKSGMNTLKELITNVREGGETEPLLAQQEQEIDKLEQFLSESDTLIGQLEGEIDSLYDQLAQQVSDNKPTEEITPRPDTDENIEEMEELLQQFIGDIQSLMRMINRLEDENDKLKERLTLESEIKQPASVNIDTNPNSKAMSNTDSQ